jgi:hypothetical protein
MKLLSSGPVSGPSDTTAVIFVEATGFFLAGRRVSKQGTVVHSGGVVVSSGGGGGILGLVYLFTAMAIWLAFRRFYTVHVHTSGHLANIHVRLPSELAAYRAAADLVPRFQAEGNAALERWLVNAASGVRMRNS